MKLIVNHDKAYSTSLPPFFIVMGGSLALLMLDFFTDGIFHVMDMAKLANIISLIITAASFILGIAIPASKRFGMGLSFASMSIAVLLSLTTSLESGLLFDVMILLVISILFAMFINPIVGVSHGVITAVLLGMHIFRYSTVFVWTSDNIFILMGVYISVISLIGHYSDRFLMYERDFLVEQVKNYRLGSKLKDSHLLNEINAMFAQLTYPLYIKVGNAVASMDNLSNVLQEIRGGEGMLQSQYEMMEDLRKRLSTNIHSVHKMVRMFSELKTLEDKKSEFSDIHLEQLVSECNEKMNAQYGLLPDISFAATADHILRGNRDLFKSLFLNLLEFSYLQDREHSRDGIFIEVAETSTQINVNYRDGAASAVEGLSRNTHPRDVELERDLQLMFVEFLVRTNMKGAVEYIVTDGQFRARIHLPKL